MFLTGPPLLQLAVDKLGYRFAPAATSLPLPLCLFGCREKVLAIRCAVQGVNVTPTRCHPQALRKAFNQPVAAAVMNEKLSESPSWDTD